MIVRRGVGSVGIIRGRRVLLRLFVLWRLVFYRVLLSFFFV